MIKKLKDNIFSMLKNILLGLYIDIFISNNAYATAVGDVIGYTCGWLSGEIGVSIGGAAVIWTGYEMLQGEINLKTFGSRLVGIGLIVGGAYITTNVFHIGRV